MSNLLNLGAIALFTISKQAQAQENPFSPLPTWMWVGVVLLIVVIAIIWTLREEENKQKQVKPATIPEPVGRSGSVAPVAEKPAKPVEEPAPTMAREPAPSPAPEPIPSPKPDDLRKVSGIGPKIQQILNQNGIYTFEQLAAVDADLLDRLMDEQGWHMANSATWKEQARALAEAKKDDQ